MHLPLYLSILLTASAVHVPLQPRVNACDAAIQDNEGDELTAPTSDRTAGIGAEFESPFFYLMNAACNTIGRSGKLHAEYILNGQNIKVGTGDATRAGAAAAADLIAWQPWNGADTDNIDVANSKCNPWSIGSPSKGTKPEDVEWDAQITAPMPLEALYSLMKEDLADILPPERNILAGSETARAGNPDAGNLFVVTDQYFQSNTNGINQSKVSDDVLGFCSLVLSYAKGAHYPLGRDQSPKLMLPFMPRTEFNTIFQQVKSKIPGDLFTLFNSLACYKTEDGNVKIDGIYCSGSLAKPVSNNNFGRLTFKNSAASVNIKTWIQGIGSGTGAKDALSVFDESIDGSIGGLKTATEKMYNSQRSVPLFEFRDLIDTHSTTEFEIFMGRVDTAVQALHRTFANPPQRKKRDVPASCYMTSAATGTGSATSSVPVSITPAPTPSGELHNEDPDQGINQAFCLCDKCGLVAGCTPTAAPSPTIAAWVGNLSTIDIGNAEDGNGGKDLATEMFGKLKAMCSGSTCKGDHAEMDNVEAAIADGEEPLKPAMYLQDATFTSQAVLEKMLSVGISSWVSALNDPTLKLCKNVTYEADADETGLGCGKGPIPTSRLRRKVRRDDGAVLWERGGLVAEQSRLAQRCLDNCDRPVVCHYEARMCSAPNEITVVMAGAGDPYANRLNIGVTLDASGHGFLCEEITAALTAAVVLLAPELLGVDALEGVELEAVCGIIHDPSSIIDNLKEPLKVSRRAPKAVPA
ncbi:Uncharacterized protein BP5553_09112 [Venustampulla echinocandica]|uniref:Uncharacterized protein n=1 Tax=Venustampulla echinocandica TaxID=2656787 RepID=A0A370TDW6_9HELO|nr:Uncharacterized protein BP5553_09112 [Venustampulla echinocandica]RDL32656.1 Uncharacterized protein BP5553_09112 [Venustampulla echinocandica]